MVHDFHVHGMDLLGLFGALMKLIPIPELLPWTNLYVCAYDLHACMLGCTSGKAVDR